VIVPLDLLLFTVLLITAVLALRVKDLLTATVMLAAYSLFAALLFTAMAAVDVGLVEGALGAGLTGVLFIATILVTTNDATARTSLRRRLGVLPFIAGFLGLLLYSSTGLPDRGAADAPAQRGVSTAFIEGSMEETQTPNVVTSLLADYRSQDTLGETLVILTAALSTALVLARRPDRPHEDVEDEQERHDQDDPELRGDAPTARARGEAEEGGP
jgi:multicomponent Na+:H+ antiporter subunit B